MFYGDRTVGEIKSSQFVVLETRLALLEFVSLWATCSEINAHDPLSTKWCMLYSTARERKSVVGWRGMR